MVMFMEENASVRLCHQSTSSRRQTQSFLVIYPHVIRLINGYQKSSIDGDLDGKIKNPLKMDIHGGLSGKPCLMTPEGTETPMETGQNSPFLSSYPFGGPRNGFHMGYIGR